jgi:hypothetical protein
MAPKAISARDRPSKKLGMVSLCRFHQNIHQRLSGASREKNRAKTIATAIHAGRGVAQAAKGKRQAEMIPAQCRAALLIVVILLVRLSAASFELASNSPLAMSRPAKFRKARRAATKPRKRD